VVEVFQTLTVVERVEMEDPVKAVNQISLEEAARRASRRVGDELLFRSSNRPEDEEEARVQDERLRRHPPAEDVPQGLRAHRRADREAGDHPAHSRRRARERLQRLQGPQGRDRLGHRAAIRARNIIVNLGAPRPYSRCASRPARELPGRRPGPAFVLDVLRESKGPQIILSAHSPTWSASCSR